MGTITLDRRTDATNATRDRNERRRTRTLLWVNALGGTAVLASYAWGMLARPEAMGALWGGVPEALRPVYTINMLLAAAGYFLFAPYIAFRLPPGSTRIGGRFGYGLFTLAFALVLVPSALWLPLTARLVDAPDVLLWWAIRLDLALVGVGALGLLAALVSLGPDAPRGRRLAILGLIPFCLQTVVLDGLVWPAYFPAP